jgi:gliding motility-associated-like protein
MLQLDYKNVTYSGVDKLTIKACDLLNACTENVLAITVDPQPKEIPTGDIIVYNAVSANNDDLNSYLRIENVEQHPSRVFIYNRWGDQVFAVDNYNNTISCKRFEGISSDGRHLPTGTYFYKIEFADNKPTVTGFLALTTE